MDREDIRNSVRRKLQDTNTDSNNQMFSDVVLNTEINSAHEAICARSKAIEEQYTTNLVAGTAEYTLPDYYLEEQEVEYLNSDGVYIELDKKTEKELSREQSTWRDESGTPYYYYLRDGKIGLFPKPSEARTNGLRINMVRMPYSTTPADDLSLSADSSVPYGGNNELYPFHDLIVYDVASRCKIDQKQFDEAAKLLQLSEKMLVEMKSQIASKNQETRIYNLYEQSRSSARRTS